MSMESLLSFPMGMMHIMIRPCIHQLARVAAWSFLARFPDS